MLEQRDLDLMKSDAQLIFGDVLEDFNKAFLGGRYGGYEQYHSPAQGTNMDGLIEGEQEAGELLGEVEQD